jgi:hypothetical protein
MRKIVLVAALFVAAYSVNAQGSGSPVPTPGTHVNKDDITFTLTPVVVNINGVNHGNANPNVHWTLVIDGAFVGLGSAAKDGTGPNYYSIDATVNIDKDCGPNPSGNVPPGLSRTKHKALSIGSSVITRNGRMPWSATVHVPGNAFCPTPFTLLSYGFSMSIEDGDDGFRVNGISVPLK